MTHYCYSTLTNDHRYTNYKPSAPTASHNEIESEVLVMGGANRTTAQLVTPLGVRTEIDDEQYEALKKNLVFQSHLKTGLVVVRPDKVDPEVAVAADMTQRDNSAPLTPETLATSEDGPKPMEEKPSLMDKVRKMASA